MSGSVQEAAVREAEPLGMTQGDAVAVVLGIALGSASLGVWQTMSAGLPWFGLGLFLRNGAVLWFAAVVLGVAAVWRVIRYRRSPRSAEWLALGAVAWGLALLVPPSALEDFIQLVGRGARPIGESELTARWVTAVVGAGMVALGLGLARTGQGVVAPPFLVGWLGFLLFLAFWCPLSLFNDHAADWFAPSAGFGPGTVMILYRGVCQWFAALPTGLLVGLPLVATVSQRLAHRRWSWLEWAAATTATLAGLLAALVYRGELPAGSPGWVAERIIALLWLVVVGLIARALLRHRGRHWLSAPV